MNIPTGFLDSSGSVPFSLPERDPQGDDPVAKRISHNLQRLRDKRQLSLEALAHASGVRRAMIAQIEAGRSFPSVKVLSKVAAALKVSIAEFLDPDGAGMVIRRALPPEHAAPPGDVQRAAPGAPGRGKSARQPPWRAKPPAGGRGHSGAENQ